MGLLYDIEYGEWKSNMKLNMVKRGSNMKLNVVTRVYVTLIMVWWVLDVTQNL